MPSNASIISKLLQPGAEGSIVSAEGTASAGTSTYATPDDLPLVNNNAGDTAFVESSDRLYIWTGTGWYNIALINTAPNITGGGAGVYNLATDGTPTVITLTAEDPEGLPITWSYTVTSGSLGSTATISQADNVFTITPSTQEADVGEFTITFTASDGVNIATDVNTFELAFAAALSNDVTATEISDGGFNYELFEFTTSGSITFYKTTEIEYVLVAGGGAGGSGEQTNLGDGGGGGGAGGVLEGTTVISPGTYNINVGNGGTSSYRHIHPAGDGEDTTLIGGSVNLVAFGGGSGGHEGEFGQDGGSSGGAGGICTQATGAGNLEGTGQGYRGGERPGDTSCGNYRGGAGGGGAGGAGTANTNGGGAGGAGRDISITGTTVTLAGGGGGGRGANAGQSSNGGTGGGGAGNSSATYYGGGGGGGASGNYPGGDGYQGIVWIRYKVQ